ncbi:hypothetical protein VTL71DRAFT_14936 [Oculimacula yallundae]|uniref:Uncharacterized protein n=1 Tax=Oculimacula yallundae TaxID=86028 RepID=A0ABR4CHF4_9HELO
MKLTLIALSLAAQLVLTTALSNHPRLHARQEDTSDDERVIDPAYEYLQRMCYPATYPYTFGLLDSNGEYFSHGANSSAPCDQKFYIAGSCIANGTVPAVDFAAEQQCLCGSNYFAAELGCDACYKAHGYPYILEDKENIAHYSSLSSAECQASPYPTVPYRNLLTIITLTGTNALPLLTLSDDKFPNQTAVSNYWTTDTRSAATLGSITGAATGRQTERTATAYELFTPSSTPSTLPSTSPSTTPAPTGNASGSGSGTVTVAPASSSTAAGAAGDVTVAGGFLLVVVNVVAVMLM